MRIIWNDRYPLTGFRMKCYIIKTIFSRSGFTMSDTFTFHKTSFSSHFTTMSCYHCPLTKKWVGRKWQKWDTYMIDIIYSFSSKKCRLSVCMKTCNKPWPYKDLKCVSIKRPPVKFLASRLFLKGTREWKL